MVMVLADSVTLSESKSPKSAELKSSLTRFNVSKAVLGAMSPERSVSRKVFDNVNVAMGVSVQRLINEE
jgi:hypothetical protein